MPRVTDIEQELLAEMRGEIALYRRRGMRQDADFLESVVEDLAQKIRSSLILRLCDPMPVASAAAMLGYSESQLYRLIDNGVPNWERDGVKVVRPIDCPVKAGMLPALLGITPPPSFRPHGSTLPSEPGAEDVDDLDPSRPWALKAG